MSKKLLFLISTEGKTIEQIKAEAVAAFKKNGLLKETPKKKQKRKFVPDLGASN